MIWLGGMGEGGDELMMTEDCQRAKMGILTSHIMPITAITIKSPSTAARTSTHRTSGAPPRGPDICVQREVVEGREVLVA